MKPSIERLAKVLAILLTTRRTTIDHLVEETGIPRRTMYRYISAIETALPILLDNGVIKYIGAK